MANFSSTKAGNILAKGLGIKLDPNKTSRDAVTRGESVFSISSADTYVEEEPTVGEWVRDFLPDRHDVTTYVSNLFPFLRWIGFYNRQWLYGDLVAGITVGAVVVPQSMAYAKLANVPVEYGLYSSFMGVLIYWFFATSKDITIGPVAVMSTVVGNIVTRTNGILPPEERGPVVASALAIIAGAIVIGIGLLRWGFLVDFISLTSISAFMTGSALNIAVGQVPTMMGLTGFSSRDSTYLVIINSLKNLGTTTLDAAMGLTALTMLYVIRSACTYGAKRMPQRKKLFFFLGTLRTVFVILLYTLISFLVNRNRRAAGQRAFQLLGDVPRGFQHAGVPVINTRIINSFTSDLPAAVIVLLIEHISISKSFGRVNGYTIDPSQELVAIGVTNLIAPFLGAYPATGSFSRTAIKSKAGVRTPFAGVITALVVLLAIYALPAVFFYIPNASLAAVIIHAVGDLITPPATVYRFWRISPFEVLIFFAGVLVTVFSSIENGIYVTIAVSAVLFVIRIFKAKGQFLGKVKAHTVIGDHNLADDVYQKTGFNSSTNKLRADPDDRESKRNVFLPLDHTDGSNPDVDVVAPYPGVYILHFTEGLSYINATHYMDQLAARVFKETKRTNPNSYPRLGDRPWNDPGPSRKGNTNVDDARPTLKAIILDFSSVNNVDVTTVQLLIDVRNQMDRHTAPDRIEWHFACVQNRWTKRALASAGFGLPNIAGVDDGNVQRWKPVFSVAEIGGSDSAAAYEQWKRTRDTHAQDDIERQMSRVEASGGKGKLAVLHGLNRPLFHADLTSAVQSAIHAIENRTEFVDTEAKRLDTPDTPSLEAQDKAEQEAEGRRL